MLGYWEGRDESIIKDVNTQMHQLKFFYDEPIYVILMDYLGPPTWTPLSKMKDINKDLLYTTIKSLVYDSGIYNPIDLVGYTGDHIFYNEKTEQFKIIDYGLFKDVKETDVKDALVDTMWQSIMLSP